ncbi:cyclin-dependent kinase 2-associated protein 1-like [Sabethes cyaneus]|uniref:cyclin-dependent kinase 2-associated protein 1-like n=1 Tax=Sabethes cyaneus TaxID=53552 RepID=UPI00221E3609|nr:cyclin-dependent kinase 2-associated protein 1-like [Sabethes cyaneus]
MNYMDVHAVESQLMDITATPVQLAVRHSAGFPNISFAKQQQLQNVCQLSASTSRVPNIATNKSAYDSNTSVSKYSQLLMILEEMARDIRPTYSGSRSSTERLKRGIVNARLLVRECLLEAEKSARQ